MVLEKWVLLCRKCGWRKEVPLLWADLKPKCCGNKKCKCAFTMEPDSLAAFKLEERVIVEEPEVVSYKNKKNKNW